MSVLATIELVFTNDEAEQKFFAYFTRAMGVLPEIKGLIEMSAWKKLGVERTYMAFTEWESEEDVERWVQGEKERQNIAFAHGQLCISTHSARWQLLSRKDWQR